MKRSIAARYGRLVSIEKDTILKQIFRTAAKTLILTWTDADFRR